MDIVDGPPLKPELTAVTAGKQSRAHFFENILDLQSKL